MYWAENGFGIVINKNGEYVAAKDMQLVHSKVNFYNVCSDGGDAYDISLLKGNGSSGVGFIKLDNVRYCASYKNIDINGWKVIIAMPEKEVLEQSNTYLESQVLNIIALVFLMLGITIILYNWISNERKSYKDGLTKLYNRDKYNEVIKKLENNSKDRVVVICFDLNDFKHVNDAYGHSVGDSLLISFSKILANTVGRTGFISRIGGDEFTGILKNATDDQINNIIMQVENLIKIHNKKNFKIKLSTAYGYAIKEPNEIIKMETLVNEADKKMYENKEKYKNSLIKKSI
ncbi:MAG: diguanylate cyclase [Clostridiales bacterium]|nr:diguanylate cyclase [Clostridiales bacterium]